MTILMGSHLTWSLGNCTVTEKVTATSFITSLYRRGANTWGGGGESVDWVLVTVRG